jgi:UDP-arabinose 4-epimerase
MSEKRAKILVAGGAGYIGSHTAKLLHKNGFEPVVLDNFCTGNPFAVRYGPLVKADIADGDAVRSLLEEHRPEAVILFAAHAYVGESTANPRKYYRNNLTNGLAFLDALIAEDVRKLVFSSSCSIYGTQATGPIGESQAKDPLSPYAETKWFFERILHWCAKSDGLESVRLRYFNAAGADPDGELGEHHDPETHLIPLTIAAAQGGAPLRVFGTDYPTPDGTAIRDYIHVTDLAGAHVKALNYLIGGGASISLNLGTGRGASVREVISMVEKVSGRPVPVEYGPRRDGDAPALVANPNLARETLNWQPQYSSLETIVSTAWRWHNELAAAATGETAKKDSMLQA